MIDNVKLLPPDKASQFMCVLRNAMDEIHEGVIIIQDKLSVIELSQTEHDIFANFNTIYRMCVDKLDIMEERYGDGEGITSLHLFDVANTLGLLADITRSVHIIIIYNDNFSEYEKRNISFRVGMIQTSVSWASKKLYHIYEESRGDLK